MLAKDVVKAVKRRLQHKNPKVQLLSLTLLETMVKNCGDYVHFQIAERNILPEMVKIVKKKTDLHVRDKILTLIGSWHEAFGGSGGRYPQYYMAYEDLRRSGIQFPQRSPDPVPIFTPPATHPAPRPPQPGYGMPSGSSTRLDEAMAAEESLSLSSLNSMREVLDLLADMLKAVDPNDRLAIKDEVITDLVEQCRTNQRKLVQSLATISDEELLGQGLELNDTLQGVLAKHDAIASGSPLPPEAPNATHLVSEKHDSNAKPAEASIPNIKSIDSPSAQKFPAHQNVIEEEDEEEDDFAQLARRHSKTPNDATVGKSDEIPFSPDMSNAIVPVSMPAAERSKDQDIIDLLSITLVTPISEEETSAAPPTSQTHVPGQIPPSSGVTFSSQAYPDMTFNSYVAPWAQPQPQPQPQYRQLSPTQPQPQAQYRNFSTTQPQPQLQYQHLSPTQPEPQLQPRPQSQHLSPSQVQPQRQYQHISPSQPQMQPQYQHVAQAQAQQFQSQPVTHSRSERQPPHQPYQTPGQPALHAPRAQPQFPQQQVYPPPPWAATPGYLSNQGSASRPLYTYPTARPTSSPNSGSSHQMSINGDLHITSSANSTPPSNAGPKPFIPSYRLFEDLDVFGNTDRKYKVVSNPSPSLMGSNNQNMVGGRK